MTKETVITNRLDFMSEVLYNFCERYNLEFLSADDLLVSLDSSNELTEYQRDWLNAYCQTWDILQQAEYEDEDPISEVEQCIIDTNGDYAECVDHLVETMELSEVSNK